MFLQLIFKKLAKNSFFKISAFRTSDFASCAGKVFKHTVSVLLMAAIFVAKNNIHKYLLDLSGFEEYFDIR